MVLTVACYARCRGAGERVEDAADCGTVSSRRWGQGLENSPWRFSSSAETAVAARAATRMVLVLKYMALGGGYVEGTVKK